MAHLGPSIDFRFNDFRRRVRAVLTLVEPPPSELDVCGGVYQEHRIKPGSIWVDKDGNIIPPPSDAGPPPEPKPGDPPIKWQPDSIMNRKP